MYIDEGEHPMTALADMLSRADHQRLLEHLAEAEELDRLMRQPGGLPAVPEPPPLCRTGREEENR
jgi:hypothetical protein